MKSEIITELESKGFEALTPQTHYNYETKIEVIIIEDQVSVSNGRKKLYMGKLEKDKVLESIN